MEQPKAIKTRIQLTQTELRIIIDALDKAQIEHSMVSGTWGNTDAVDECDGHEQAALDIIRLKVCVLYPARVRMERQAQMARKSNLLTH